jgi:hypothetical protein
MLSIARTVIVAVLAPLAGRTAELAVMVEFAAESGADETG